MLATYCAARSARSARSASRAMTVCWARLTCVSQHRWLGGVRQMGQQVVVQRRQFRPGRDVAGFREPHLIHVTAEGRVEPRQRLRDLPLQDGELGVNALGVNATGAHGLSVEISGFHKLQEVAVQYGMIVCYQTSEQRIPVRWLGAYGKNLLAYLLQSSAEGCCPPAAAGRLSRPTGRAYRAALPTAPRATPVAAAVPGSRVAARSDTTPGYRYPPSIHSVVAAVPACACQSS